MKKNLLTLLAIIHFGQVTYSQFKATAGGFAFHSQAIISSVGYSKAGGGVILKGKAEAVLSDVSVIFHDATIENEAGKSKIKFTTSKCNVSMLYDEWLLRDAAALVNSETNGQIYRDVNILGKPQNAADSLNYPITDYFYVELNNELIGSKSGQMLLLVDLLQTDVSFYKDSITKLQNVEDYNRVLDLLKNYSIDESYDKYLKYSFSKDSAALEKFTPNKKSEFAAITLDELDSIRLPLIEHFSTRYLYTRNPDYELIFDSLHQSTDWTYNDEHTKYTYSCSCEDGVLFLDGSPNFTYLTLGCVNNLYTEYFKTHPTLITNLKPETFVKVKEFAQVASLFRYLKSNYSDVWSKIITYYKGLPFTPDPNNTPRIIQK